MRTLLVGFAPSRSSDPSRPLSGASGRRLERWAGLGPGELPRAFRLVNLLDRWPGAAAKGDRVVRRDVEAAAERLRPRLRGRVVFLGVEAALAFGLATRPLEWTSDGRAWVPHPSGVNHYWNDPRRVRQVERFLRAEV